MIDSYIRPAVQGSVVEPTVSRLALMRLSPMQITGLALMLGLAASSAIALSMPVWAVVFLALSGCCDILDGTVARLQGQSSPLGAVMDISCDRIVEASVIIGLCLVSPAQRGLLCTLMLGSVLLCVTTFLVVGVFTQNDGEKSFYYSPGVMERTEAFLFFCAMILLPQYFVGLSLAFTVLVLLTAFMRLGQFAYRHTAL